MSANEIALEPLLDALRAKFTSLSSDLKEARDQTDKLKALLNQLTAERDALSARITGLQNAARHDNVPPVELLPFARRLLELASRSGTLPPDQLRDQLMQLAIDAIAQAEGRQGNDLHEGGIQQPPAKAQEHAASTTTASVPAPAPTPSPEGRRRPTCKPGGYTPTQTGTHKS